MGRRKRGRKGPSRQQISDRIETGSSGEKEKSTNGTPLEKVENTANPIDVFSRLRYPPVAPCREDDLPDDLPDDSEDDEEETIVLNFKPRFVFAANLCLICMESSRIPCESCRMVSYCSPKHREKSWPTHRDLCAHLSVIRGSLDRETTRGLDPNEFRIYRTKLLEVLQKSTRRDLEAWEREIVLYPRVCRTCRVSVDLIRCRFCGMEDFCKNHQENRDEGRCREFQVFRRCLLTQHRVGYVETKIPSVPRDAVFPLPESLDELILRIYGRGSSYYRGMDCHAYTSLSQLCTIPFTALHSMQISCPEWQSKTEWTIHVLGAEFQFEGINLRVWEKAFLHFLPNLKRLSLILVGPELRLPAGVPPELLARVKLCSACESSGRSVDVLFHPQKLYHELLLAKVQSRIEEEPLSEPDLICLFNPGLYRNTGFEGKDTWPRTIRDFCRSGVPVLVTSYTEEEIPREILRIKSICDVDVLLEPRRNPFASIKPDRNFVSDDTAPLIYKNYCLTIVRGKNLLPSH